MGPHARVPGLLSEHCRCPARATRPRLDGLAACAALRPLGGDAPCWWLTKDWASMSSGISGPSRATRARRQWRGTCAMPSVTLGWASTRSLRLLPAGT